MSYNSKILHIIHKILTSIITELEENTTIGNGIKVADIAIVDDALGDNLLSLTGTDADDFEIRGNELFYIGESPDFESKNQYQVTVNVQDLSLGDDVFASNDFTLTISDVNEPPTAVNLASVISELEENTAIGNGIKVADIAIVDDALGENLLSLTGADADSFEIRGNELFYIGESPDFESKNQYQVTVNVQDLSLGDDIFASNNFILTILDVNEPPTAVNLTSVITELAENTAIDDGIKVADIVVVDDALGENILSLTGGDADSFEIRGSELFYIGASPDFESKNQYQVTVNVQNLSLGDDIFASDNFTLTILDVNEAPIVNIPIADQNLEEADTFTLTIPENTFTDPDGDTLFFSATLEDGITPLPNWLTFDPETLTFSGTPTSGDVGIVNVGVFANDGELTTSDVFHHYDRTKTNKYCLCGFFSRWCNCFSTKSQYSSHIHCR